ncbi:PREDICTED: uncharacterized protein LOC108764872 [Trachymyrmex cornetzi]|uniref:uncharacterized protein LOC108764872 n=1 Tax=Trachymyrmex cornetzi TaxID=471704 RepID=UPI00084F8246|nr:PREDICTED: uncharacterized protein LOC108764872 [Trachymyrmex cornetzi]
MESVYFQETDDMELIKLVESNCCVYNKRTWEFKTADKREVWALIGAALTNKKTGDQAQRRWDSLRAMWSRQHKKYYEQGDQDRVQQVRTRRNSNIMVNWHSLSHITVHDKPNQT